MKILAWNCLGLGNSRSVQALNHLVQRYNPHIIFLIETRLSIRKMEVAARKAGFVGCIATSGVDGSTGLALLWREGFSVQLKSFSNSHIDGLTHCVGETVSWRLTGFYGSPIYQKRINSWNLLRRLRDCSSLPWLVLGDFNEILDSSEKSGGRVRCRRAMMEFQSGLEDCQLLDLGYQGGKFTWCNNRQDGVIYERIDRAVASAAWSNLFPKAKVSHIVCSVSDHKPILMDSDPCPGGGFFVRRFRFEEMWTRHEGLDEVVKEGWVCGRGSVLDKIHSVAKNLQCWDRFVFGSIRKLLLEKHKRLEWLHQCPQDADSLTEINRGDRSTKFFHKKASQRNKNNQLLGIEDDLGRWVEGEEELASVILGFYEKLFHSDNPPLAVDEMLDISKVVDGSMNEVLDLVKGDVIRLVQDFFQSGRMVEGVNDTHICLIPKVLNPKRVVNFRPISLCNVVYKVISKLIANRLKLLMPSYVSDSQSAFVKGRLITDNILVAFEVMHYLKSKGSGGDSF
ncbi:uncharacterized protein LOC119987879 [Tripterygium wilfordii]|uniref:uncharacterized protein LOC119987879 n=1 Tax=Tripterygium wilfordii TaxID=458696 RepID=UPI0018F82588|nr:uncharacterized protein LOC119987879 [Tripterygium wilfordii]